MTDNYNKVKWTRRSGGRITAETATWRNNVRDFNLRADSPDTAILTMSSLPRSRVIEM